MPAQCAQIPAGEPSDTYWSTVSDLVSLIHRTRSYELVNEVAQLEEAATNVVVLDDVTSARAPELLLLDDCNLRLREALHLLLEAKASRKHVGTGIERFKGNDQVPVALDPAG